MPTYPVNPSLPAGTGTTEVNPTNWATLVDNINAIGADLVAARADTADFAGTDHSASQSSNIQEMLESIRHMLEHMNGLASNWYNLPVRILEIHPEYPGGLRTTSLRGGAASGQNTVTESTGEDVVSNVARHFYENTSSEASLQTSYVAVRITLPDDFTAWATSNALQIDFRTESGTSANCHIDAYIYQSGNATLVASSENNAGTSWATITLDDSVLDSAHSWAAGDKIEIYLKLETRNNYYARVGRVRLNYTS